MANNAEVVRQAMGQSVAQNGARTNLAGMTQGQIADFLKGMSSRMAQVLPKHLTPERMLQMASMTIYKNPNIAECEVASLCGAVMQASILGFPPVDSLNYCYFVPYGKQVQFQIGYLGLIELARRSGKIKTIYAEVVREGDEFVCEMGLESKLIHKPKFDSSKPLTHVYAVAHFADGGYNFVVLSKSDVERLRMMSPMQKGAPTGAWKLSYDSMAKAKAVKQLAKYLPLNLDERTNIMSDGAIITPESFDANNGGLKPETMVYEPTEVEENAAPTENATVVVNKETGEIKE